MGTRKIQDLGEILRWFEEGWTYRQMADEYLRKYNLEVGTSMFGNIRRREGLARRITRDDDLIPWEIKPEHRWAWDVQMLRLEARRRAGIRGLSDDEQHSLDAWKAGLEEDGAVIHYDPDTERGFFRILRQEGDLDLIHEPKRKTTRQPNTDDDLVS